MSAAEALQAVIELLALSNQYSESLWRNIDIWIGLSIGLVILTYTAPDKLTWKTGPILVLLYSAYSYILVEKTMQLQSSLELSRGDAVRIAEENNLLISALDAISGTTGGINGNVIMFLFFGTFLSATSFVFYSCWVSGQKNK